MLKKGSNIKSGLATILKLGLAFGLIYWMWTSGKLDFEKLKVVLTDGYLLSLTIGVWVTTQILGAIRWRILLAGLGYNISVWRSIQLHLTGIFFNTAMPGAVGGDIIKATYVILDNKDLGKSPAMTSVLMDRILGLFGLFTIGAVVVLLNVATISHIPALKPVAGAVMGLVAFTGLFLYLVSKTYKSDDPILRLVESSYPGSSFVQKIYKTFRQFENNPSYLIKAWLLSVGIQGAVLIYFCILTQALQAEVIETSQIAMIFPIGILVTALPIAPGGLGVGHVAFDQLFAIIGHHGGATIFNAYALGMLALNLTGIIGYISLRKKKSLPASTMFETREVS